MDLQGDLMKNVKHSSSMKRCLHSKNCQPPVLKAGSFSKPKIPKFLVFLGIGFRGLLVCMEEFNYLYRESINKVRTFEEFLLKMISPIWN